MESNKIELIVSDEETYQFENQLNTVSNKTPFKELVSSDGYFDYKLKLDDNDAVSFNDLFHLKVNVKNVGSFDFFFISKDFNKDEVIEKISVLKEIEVIDIETAKNKVNKLFESFGDSKSLFLIYSPEGEYMLSNNDIQLDTFIFFLEGVEENKAVEKKKEKKPIEKPESKNTVWRKISRFFSPLKENYIHYLFILISVVLIGFTSSMSAFNFYVGNNLFYIFFVCTLIGTVLETFVFIDYFKKHQIKSKDFILTVMDIIIATGLAIGAYYIFYIAQKVIPEKLTSSSTIVWIMTLVIIGCSFISCTIGYLINKRQKK